MANTWTAAYRTNWSKYFETTLPAEVEGLRFCSTKEENEMTYKKVVERPYYNRPYALNYSGSAVTAQDITATSNQMTINIKKAINIELGEDDMRQITNPETRLGLINSMRDAMAENMDAEILYQAYYANDYIDAGDVGGSAGSPITLTSSNVALVFSAALAQLGSQNALAGGKGLSAYISYKTYQSLLDYVGGKDSALGDKTSEKGMVGTFLGFKLYLTNLLTSSFKIDYGTSVPTDGDTIVINGTTLTWETGTIDTAGEIKAETDEATSLLNLVNMINTGKGTGSSSAKYYGWTLDGTAAISGYVNTLQNCVAVPDDATTPTYVTIYLKGVSAPTFTETGSSGTISLSTCHNLFGVDGSIDVVRQAKYEVREGDQTVNGKWSKNYMVNSLYGVKTFYEGKYKIVNVKIAL